MTETTLERFAAGDLVAFEALFRQFQGPVFGWIMRIVRDRGAAEELTVETFWRAWNARARFDPQREFGAWARRIAGMADARRTLFAWRSRDLSRRNRIGCVADPTRCAPVTDAK